MPLVRTRAVTLKSQRWGEADRIVTLYTERIGKIRGIGLGARRMKSRLGSVLEPLRFIELTVFEKTPDTLVRISQADLLKSFDHIRTSLLIIGAAACMVQVVEALTVDRDPNYALFASLVGGLQALHEGGDPALIPLLFQIQALDHTGFHPQMDQCVLCSQSSLAIDTRFSPVSGGLLCAHCWERVPDESFHVSQGSIAFIRQVGHLGFPLVTRLRVSGQIQKEVEAMVQSHFTMVTGRSLPTQDLWAAESSPPRYGSESLTRSPQNEEPSDHDKG